MLANVSVSGRPVPVKDRDVIPMAAIAPIKDRDVCPVAAVAPHHRDVRPMVAIAPPSQGRLPHGGRCPLSRKGTSLWRLLPTVEDSDV